MTEHNQDGLFPPLMPYDAGWLPVSAGHRIAYTQHGNPKGIPAIVLHGGPGSGSSHQQVRFFDPGRYRVIQFDQRGCGLSQPAGEIAHNRTDDLIADIEALRRHLNVERWLVVGGSWGAALAALYAAQHQGVVTGMLLRALFLCSESDLDWFFQRASAFYSEPWRALVRAASPDAPGELFQRVCHTFLHSTDAEQYGAARAWFAWERALSGLAPKPPPEGDTLRALCVRYRIQSHYLANRCWLGTNGVLEACAALTGVKVMILQGSCDAICRPAGARQAHRACPGSNLIQVAGADHDPFHPAMIRAMRTALESFAAPSGFRRD